MSPKHNNWIPAARKLMKEWAKDENGIPPTAAHVLIARDVDCPKCRVKVPGPTQEAHFCLNCGHDFQTMPCKICHHDQRIPAKYCSNCGNNLTGKVHTK